MWSRTDRWFRCASGSGRRIAVTAGFDAATLTRLIALLEREDPTPGKGLEARKPRYQARRWVVERTHSWFNRFRKLLVSFEKTEASYTGLLSLAVALISWRQAVSIYG